ncbi:MAG: hypothetical protein WCG83_03050 [Candidatus Peregrinibacteria bacterium]
MTDQPTPPAIHSLTDEQQKKIGQSVPQKMDDKHEAFMKEILRLIEKKEIELGKPHTFVNEAVFATLSESEQDQVDVALFNIVNLLTRIVEFRVSKHTPDESIELQSMIEHLWQMKERIEVKHDVLKF